MRNIIITILIVVFVVLVYNSASARSRNTTGTIDSIYQAGSSPYVTVTGRTEGGKLWLGFSYKCGSGGWKDIPPKRVKGSFRKNFTMGLCPQGYSAIRSCLWEGKDGRLMVGRIDCRDY